MVPALNSPPAAFTPSIPPLPHHLHQTSPLVFFLLPFFLPHLFSPLTSFWSQEKQSTWQDGEEHKTSFLSKLNACCILIAPPSLKASFHRRKGKLFDSVSCVQLFLFVFSFFFETSDPN